MSIASELTALQTDITNARAAIVSKGGTVTSGGGSSQLATDIGTIVTGITPTGTISITSNGTHDVTNYASANVNVPQTTVTSYTATANGTYNAPSGTAYGTFIVAIPVYNGEVV